MQHFDALAIQIDNFEWRCLKCTIKSFLEKYEVSVLNESNYSVDRV